MTVQFSTTERFVRAIRTALVGPPELSQRDLCKKLGVTIGSLSKYLRGEVAPDKVGFGVQCRLAGVMGHTVDSLMRYYETGEWSSETSAVKTWSTGFAVTQARMILPAILESMSAMAWRSAEVKISALVQPSKADYLWPSN